MGARFRVAAFFVLLVTAMGTALPQTEDADADAEALKRQLDEIDQQLRILQRKEELAQEAAAAKKPAIVEVGDKGFSLTSADGAHQLRIRSLLQVDGRAFHDDGNVDGNDTLLIRRARIELTGTIARVFDFRVMPDFTGSTPTLLDAWVAWKVRPRLQLQLGKIKMPVGLEREQSREANLFAEFAYPTSLVPNRDIGVAIRGAAFGGGLDYYLGVSNGTTDGASIVSDNDDSKTLNWRLFATPLRASRATATGLGIGIAGTYGSVDSAAPSDYRTVGQQLFFRWRKAGTTTTGALVEGTVHRFVPQLYWYRGPWGVVAEYALSSQEIAIDGTQDTLDNTAYNLTASWVITGEDATFKGVKPKHPLGSQTGGRGSWQILARHTALTVDDDAFPIFADPAASASEARTTGAGVSWYATNQVRWFLEYDHTTFEANASAPVLPDEDVVISRIQLRF